jgi:hypothetical protein
VTADEAAHKAFSKLIVVALILLRNAQVQYCTLAKPQRKRCAFSREGLAQLQMGWTTKYKANSKSGMILRHRGHDQSRIAILLYDNDIDDEDDVDDTTIV